jgi:hypothetical protein
MDGKWFTTETRTTQRKADRKTEEKMDRARAARFDHVPADADDRHSVS